MPDPWSKDSVPFDGIQSFAPVTDAWTPQHLVGSGPDSLGCSSNLPLPWDYSSTQTGFATASDSASHSPIGQVTSLSELASEIERSEAQEAVLASGVPDAHDPEAGDDAGRSRVEFLSEKNRRVQFSGNAHRLCVVES